MVASGICSTYISNAPRKIAARIVYFFFLYLNLRQGSNALDSSSPTERPSPVILSEAKDLSAVVKRQPGFRSVPTVILSEAKDLSAYQDRPFAEFTLSEANGLRVTLYDCSNGQVQFVQIEPCLTKHV